MAKITQDIEKFLVKICGKAALTHPNFPHSGKFECYEDLSRQRYFVIFRRRLGNNVRVHEVFIDRRAIIEQNFSMISQMINNFIHKILKEAEALDSDELTNEFIDICPDYKNQDRLTDHDINIYRGGHLEKDACFDPF